jgi:hypothetical protein
MLVDFCASQHTIIDPPWQYADLERRCRYTAPMASLSISHLTKQPTCSQRHKAVFIKIGRRQLPGVARGDDGCD